MAEIATLKLYIVLKLFYFKVSWVVVKTLATEHFHVKNYDPNVFVQP